MYSYRNERFKRGNKVQLRYNPSQARDDGHWNSSLISGNNIDTARYMTSITNPVESRGIGIDVLTCSAFGGEISALRSDSDFGNGYETDGGTYSSGFVGVDIPKDCFNGNYNNYIKDYNDKVYLFEGGSSPSISDAYISEYSSSSQSSKYGKYGINYIVNPVDTIKVVIRESNFDVIAQLLMSDAVAVVSCDIDYTATKSIPDGANELVAFGGGSYNPMVRQGHLISNTIEKKRGTSTYELTIKLLG